MNNLFDTFGAYSMMEEACVGDIIVKPNLITGEGRTKLRPYSAYKVGDLKKKERRKMAKKSKRQNRRGK